LPGKSCDAGRACLVLAVGVLALVALCAHTVSNVSALVYITEFVLVIVFVREFVAEFGAGAGPSHTVSNVSALVYKTEFII